MTDRAGLLRERERGRAVPRRDRRARARRAGDAAARASRTSVFPPVGADREVKSDFQLICGHQPRPRRERARGPLPRGPPRAHRPVDVPPPGARASGPRTSSRTSTSSSTACARRDGRARHDEPRGARALPRASRRAEARGRATSATSTPRSRAWRRSRRAVASRVASVDEEIARLERSARRAPRCTRPERGPARGRARRGARGAARPLRPRAARRRPRACAPAPARSPTRGALLFAHRARRESSVNDADRLRKYLARFDLTFADASSR